MLEKLTPIIAGTLPKLMIGLLVAMPIALFLMLNQTSQILTEHFSPQTLSASADGVLDTHSEIKLQLLTVLLSFGVGLAFATTKLGRPFVQRLELWVDDVETEYQERFIEEEEETDIDDTATAKNLSSLTPEERDKYNLRVLQKQAQRDGDWFLYNHCAKKLGQPLVPFQNSAVADTSVAATVAASADVPQTGA